MILFTLKF